MRGHRGRVDVQRDRVRAGARVPHPDASRSPRGPDALEQLLVDRLQHSMGCRLRRAGAEQPCLAAIGIQIGHAITAVSEHHRHVPKHPARIVRRTPLPRLSQRVRQRAGQPDPIRQLDQQRDARMRHQPLSVRRHFYRSQTSRWLHQLGVLLGRVSRLQQSRFSRPGRTFPRSSVSPLSALPG
jgi:erythromycin esterase-like protein